MDEDAGLADRFQAHRGRLLAVAYHVLGSPGEADDAVQEAWLRLSRSDSSNIENLGGWLTTVVARVCLDMLHSRREEPAGIQLPGSAVNDPGGIDPEQEALLADSVGPALLVILHTLPPAERLAFVLHDVFAVPFAGIASIVGRSPAAARQLASRARRRVRGVALVPGTELRRQRSIVDAFLAASRGGDFEALLEALDPDVVVRSDGAEAVRGAVAVARRTSGFARFAQLTLPALIDGAVGMVAAAHGRPVTLTVFTITGAKIAAIDIIDNPGRVAGADLVILGRPAGWPPLPPGNGERPAAAPPGARLHGRYRALLQSADFQHLGGAGAGAAVAGPGKPGPGSCRKPGRLRQAGRERCASARAGRTGSRERLPGSPVGPLARDLPGGDVDAVEDVHGGDPQDQRGQLLLVVVPGGLVPDPVRYGVGPVAEPGDGFGERQGGAFGVAEVRGIPPGGQGEEPFVCLAVFPGLGRGAQAGAAPVDLAGSQVDQVERALWHAALLYGIVQRPDRGHRVGNDNARALHASLHERAPP
jgi:RNA polymerase sigma-70 factor (ECF subfamily)